MENTLVIFKYDEIMESRKWIKEIPFISFPSEWLVQIIPPFNGAVVRFRIQSGSAEISVYLDCYDRLGYYGSPYWEVYPHKEEVFRCEMKDVTSLLKAIQESINETNKG